MLLEKYQIVAQMFHGFDYKRYFSVDTKAKMNIILGDEIKTRTLSAQEHILGLPDGKNRFSKQVVLLGKAFALSVPAPEALNIKERETGCVKPDG